MYSHLVRQLQEIRETFLRHECGMSELVRIATSKNFEDPGRDMARGVIKDAYESVFDSGEKNGEMCERHRVPYVHGFCPYCEFDGLNS